MGRNWADNSSGLAMAWHGRINGCHITYCSQLLNAESEISWLPGVLARLLHAKTHGDLVHSLETDKITSFSTKRGFA
jgi:hypothetical protein